MSGYYSMTVLTVKCVDMINVLRRTLPNYRHPLLTST